MVKDRDVVDQVLAEWPRWPGSTDRTVIEDMEMEVFWQGLGIGG